MLQKNSSIYVVFYCLCFLLSLINSQYSYAQIEQTYLQEHLDTCGNNYYQKQLPIITNEKLSAELYPLCFHGFSVMYSGTTKTALWSAEYLTRERIQQASQLSRNNTFHEESRLPHRIKATLTDYKNSPFDRGHLAPNGDMATQEQQYDSFSLANIVPQNPQHNRHLWRELETKVRFLTIEYGEVYVVTGVAFQNKNLQKLQNRVFVPSHLYKAVYIPKTQQVAVYYSPNDDSQRLEIISLQMLKERIGINVMPNLLTSKSPHIATFTIYQQSSINHVEDEPIPKQPIIVLKNLLMALIQWLIGLLR